MSESDELERKDKALAYGWSAALFDEIERLSAEIERKDKVIEAAIRVHDALLARSDNVLDEEFWVLNEALEAHDKVGE